MQKRTTIAAMLLALIIPADLLSAVPSLINLQGRLTDIDGNPITSSTQVDFHLYQGGSPDEPDDGTVVYKERIIIEPGPNGIYEHHLGEGTPLEGHTFTAQDLETDSPIHLQIIVGGSALLPRLRLVSSAYSLVSEVSNTAHVAETVKPESILHESIQPQSITSTLIKPGSITPDSIQPNSLTTAQMNFDLTDYLIPPGMISMFAGSCPGGWSRFSELDGRFPMGLPSYTGNPEGSAEISGLTMIPAGDHSHTVNSHSHNQGNLSALPSNDFSCPLKSGGGHCLNHTNHTHEISGATGNSSPGTNTRGVHTHTINSDGNWRPPFLGVVFCQKD